LHISLSTMSSNVKSLLDELDKAQKYPRLSAAEESLDHLIKLVSNARKEIEACMFPPALAQAFDLLVSVVTGLGDG